MFVSKYYVSGLVGSSVCAKIIGIALKFCANAKKNKIAANGHHWPKNSGIGPVSAIFVIGPNGWEPAGMRSAWSPLYNSRPLLQRKILLKSGAVCPTIIQPA